MASSCRSWSCHPRNTQRHDTATTYSGPYPRSEPLWPVEGGIFRGSDRHWESPHLSFSAFLGGCGCAEHRTCAAELRLANPPRPVPRTSAFLRCISWSSPPALRQLYRRPVECPRISHKREADTGVNKISSTPQSSASHHNSAVLVELTSTMGMELEINLTCSTRSVQLPSVNARSATMAVLSDAKTSKSLAALMLFAHSTLRPRRCKSCSIVASGFLPLTNMMVFTGCSLCIDIGALESKLAQYAPELT